MKDLYGRGAVQEFGPLALKAVRQNMVDQGLSRKHINQRVNRIRRAFKWGVENELVPASVLLKPKPNETSSADRTANHQ